MTNKQSINEENKQYLGENLDKLPTVALPSVVYDINNEKIGEFAAEKRSIVGFKRDFKLFYFISFGY